MRRWAAAAFLVGLFALPAQAEDFNVNIDFGGAIPMSPEELSDNTDASFAIGGSISGPISGLIRWRGELGHDRVKQKLEIPELTVEENPVGITRFSGGIEVAAFNGNDIRPYGYFTVGVFHSELSSRFLTPGFPGGATVIVSETDFGLSAGAGINLLATPRVGAGFNLRFNAVFLGGDAGTFWYMTPSAQAFFRF